MRFFWGLVPLVAVAYADRDYHDEDEGGKSKSKADQKIDGYVIGIDLGTTYSCVAVYKSQSEGVQVIANDEGFRITPSYVAFDETTGEVYVGNAAKDNATLNPSNTIMDIKRLMGKSAKDPTVLADKALLPYEIVDHKGYAGVRVRVKNTPQTYTPQEISAKILKKMKQIAEKYLGAEVKHAVVTVPAYFSDAQRTATRDAGAIAGLEVLRILNEPTAAALAYGFDKKGTEKNLLVFDLGGGTFDVSLLTLDNGVFEVLATSGDTHLGGEDFDQASIRHFLDVLKKKYSIDAHDRNLPANKLAIQKLRRAVEAAKRTLSAKTSTEVWIPDLFPGVDFREEFTRAKFEELNKALFLKTLGPVQTVLKDTKLDKSDIHELILVGGSTRIPKVRQLLKDFFNGKEPVMGVNPDEAVAVGAAIQASILAIQGHSDMVLLDVTPLSLGIETAGGTMTTMVPRNTAIPVRKEQTFTTNDHNQTMVTINVYEGERARVADCNLLGKFDLSGIPPAPKGVAQIKVIYEIDANGTLTVTAHEASRPQNVKNLQVNRANQILTPDEIARMIADAEKHEAEDKAFRETTAARSDLDSYVDSLERTLRDDKAKLEAVASQSEIEELTKLTAETRSFFVSNPSATTEEYRDQKFNLERVAAPIMTRLHSGGAGAQPEYGAGDEL